MLEHKIDIVPTRFLNAQKLAEIPRSEYINGPSETEALDAKKRKSFLSMLRKKRPVVQNNVASNSKPKSLTLNIAAWLRVPESDGQSISLLVSYEDDSGKNSIVVDEAEISGNYSLMLSGRVSFKTIGSPKYIHISASGINQTQQIFIDDLFVENLKSKQLTLVALKTP